MTAPVSGQGAAALAAAATDTHRPIQTTRSAPAAAKYRVVCIDAVLYHEPSRLKVLTSLKAAKARLRRVAGKTDEHACAHPHHLERINVALGVWEPVGTPARHRSRTSRPAARTRFRKADFSRPPNPNTRGYRRRDDGVELTVTDFFCGAGGSSTGIEQVPGMHVRMAVNHWADAIETHQHNVPQADHDQANIAQTDPYRYSYTDIAWFSPECTKWSIAAGKPVDYDTDWTQPTLADDLFDPEAANDDPDKALAEEAKKRSRALMGDVPRFAAVHRYRGIIVENVPDILKWVHFDRWLKHMHQLGYRHKVITLNSAFANALGPGAPQLRDRVYVVFWLAKYRSPDFDKFLRPPAYCPHCDRIVAAMYAPKPGPRRPMRHGAQYVYRCPAKTCRLGQVYPLAVPADAILDYTLPTQVIGERTKPLKAKTCARIASGIWRYRDRFLSGAPGHAVERPAGTGRCPLTLPLMGRRGSRSLGLVMTSGGGWQSHPTPTDQPLHTVTTTEKDALVVPLEGRDGLRARHAGEPLRSQTTRQQDGVVGLPPVLPRPDGGGAWALIDESSRTPTTRVGHPAVPAPGQQALYVPLRNNANARLAADTPLQTVAAGGEHHALVMRNNTARGDQGQMCTPVEEPIRTVLADGPRQSLIGVARAVYGYDTGELRGVDEPLPTQTTVDGDALVELLADYIDRCTLRMLAIKEVQAGMDFGDWIHLLGQAKKDKMRMLGNAVTPCAARDLVAALMEAITGVDIELAPFETFRPAW